jgi:hypothetical protein
VPLAPPPGTIFKGYNAEVILAWSEVPNLRADEYYVVRIPYNLAGEVAEFWRKEPRFSVPPNFSTAQVGFEDRRYTWSVQVKRCTENCARVLDDNVKKEGVAVGPRSTEGLFYWYPDNVPSPTKTPSGGSLQG